MRDVLRPCEEPAVVWLNVTVNETPLFGEAVQAPSIKNEICQDFVNRLAASVEVERLVGGGCDRFEGKPVRSAVHLNHAARHAREIHFADHNLTSHSPSGCIVAGLPAPAHVPGQLSVISNPSPKVVIGFHQTHITIIRNRIQGRGYYR